MKKIGLIILSLVALTSCDSLLDRFPQDSLSPDTYFENETELELYTNDFYSYLPATSLYSETADVIIKQSLSSEVLGNRLVPATSSNWTFGMLRKINFFLEHSHQCSDEAARRQYDALARLFRAIFYYDKVKHYGDVPYLDHTLSSDSPELYKGRDPRKEVMAHVLEDLDYAIQYLPAKKDVYRMTKWTALAYKARIFLFEGTFRKYHGLGDWEECLQEAAAAAQEFILTSPYKLYTSGTTPYRDLFTSQSANTTEVILARAYGADMKLTHDVNGYFTSSSMGRSGVLKDVVDMYLMSDGSRFTDQEGYETMLFVDETKNRDRRLAQTIRTPGYTRVGSSVKVAPNLSATITGYQITKYVCESKYDTYNASTNDLCIIRTAEVFLALAEAKAELGTLSQSDLDATVNKTRARGGLAALSLEAANANPDPYLLDPVTGYPNVTGANAGIILEIRRERTVELLGEGLRYWDIMRWKVGNRFTRLFKGMYFNGLGLYDLDGNGEDDICIYYDTKPEVPATVILFSTEELGLPDDGVGNITRHTDYQRVWDENKDYLYPIPTDDIVLTNGAITQNPGWQNTGSENPGDAPVIDDNGGEEE